MSKQKQQPAAWFVRATIKTKLECVRFYFGLRTLHAIGVRSRGLVPLESREKNGHDDRAPLVCVCVALNGIDARITIEYTSI